MSDEDVHRMCQMLQIHSKLNSRAAKCSQDQWNLADDLFILLPFQLFSLPSLI